MTTVGVIQARMGSTRLPGKVLEPIRGRPLILWTIAAVAATAGVDAVVVATTKEPIDDPLVDLMNEAVVAVHRGPVQDVLRRVADAAEPYAPAVVLRQTADNPFPDPDVMAGQLHRLADGPFDYVGIAGLPLGIGGEAVRWDALVVADREATEPPDREHVLPFVHRRPDRFRIGSLTDVPRFTHGRYTVDTPADLAFARAVAERLSSDRPPRLAELEAIVGADPALARLNASVEQRGPESAEASLEPMAAAAATRVSKGA
jgi:spore coat polysaccharide biosynthesis protein SpsF (cytidylyltransferase family)